MYPTILQSKDDELRNRILNLLHEKGLDQMDELDLSVSGGVVTFQGRFPSCDARDRSLECCRHVAAVLRVIDRTEVSENESSRRVTPLWPVGSGKLSMASSPAAFFG